MRNPKDAERARGYRECGWWPGVPLAERFHRFVRGRPDAPAVVDDRGRGLSRGQLWREAGRLGAELAGQGVGPGDVVLIFMPNRVESVAAMLAVLRQGAVPANLPIRTDEDALRHAAALCEARALLTVERHGGIETGALSLEAAAGRPVPPAVAVVAGDGTRRWPMPGRGPHSHSRSCPDTGSDGSAGPDRDDGPARARRPGADPAPSPPAAAGLDHLMFTSSTTGPAKAVMHTGDTLAALNVTFAERFGLGPDTPIFMPSPLGHSVGVIHGARLALHTGAPLVLQDRWDPARALDTVAAHGCRFTAAATPFLKDLVDAPWPARGTSRTGTAGRRAPKLAPLDWFLCGGAQVPPSLMERAEAEFPNTRTTVLWGMTEGGLTTCTAASPREKVLTTAGVGLPGLELRTLDECGAPTAPGVEGELAMRGPGVFVGYYAQESLYESLLTPDGFFRTGDLARIDGDGYVRITGRVKDLIIRGGVNLSPVPLEDALAALPGVRAAAVVGYPDERLGERICAVLEVRGKGEAPAELGAVTSFLRERRLPKHLWPEIVRTVDELPRTAAGKVRKLVLRDRIVASDRAGRTGTEPGPATPGAGGHRSGGRPGEAGDRSRTET